MELNFKLVKGLILIRRYIENIYIGKFYFISSENIELWIFPEDKKNCFKKS
jgi:hypothetical protein